MQGLKDYILGTLIDIYEAILGVGIDGNLGMSLEQFNSSVYRGIQLIRDTVVSPVAYVILALFLVLELHQITLRMEGQQGTLGVELPFRVMVKAVLCKIAIDNAGLFLEAIFQVSLHLIHRTQSILGGGTGSMPAPNFAVFQRAIDDLSFWEGVMTSVHVTIIGLLVSLCLIIVNVIVIARFFEIFVMIAISPIPIATLPNAEMSSIAKNFFKNFAAVCLHGVFIYIVLAIFPMLFENAALGAIDGGSFNKALYSILGYCFVLVICVTASGRWAKSICNAM